jgi:hypothetical protein
MTKLSPKVTAIIRRGEQQGYVAECVEISILTQGNSTEMNRKLESKLE